MFPSRDQLIAHLEQHVSTSQVNVRFECAIERVDRDVGGWALQAGSSTLSARQVVVATGHEDHPRMPNWSGAAGFRGRLLHSSEYRNPEPVAGQAVLVVGPGCSGMEIAYDLADGGAAKVWLAVRTPPNIVLRNGPGGFPGDVIAVVLMRAPIIFADRIARLGRRVDLGDLAEFGLPVPEEGLFSRLHRDGKVPAVVDKEVIEAIKEGRIEVVSAVADLDSTGVQLVNGRQITPDAVICATGFRQGLEPLVGHLGVLNDRGLPRSQGAEAPAPGLRFIGFSTRPGLLGYAARQAKSAASAIRDELRDTGDRPAVQAASGASSNSLV
jgi:cation diffusion facilitator CzcD-associated flavoprotein CzcO